MERRPEFDVGNIIVLGKFEAGTLSPAWFARNNLLRSEEVAAAELKFFMQDLVEWRADWLHVQATDQRLMVANVSGHHWDPVPDLACGILRLLPSATVRVLGINRLMQFAAPSTDAWHRIGHALAPKEAWAEVLPAHLGMKTLVIESRGPASKSSPERPMVTVKVEPSVTLENGVFVDVNHHMQLPHQDAEAATAAIATHWNIAMSKSLEIARRVLQLGDSDEQR